MVRDPVMQSSTTNYEPQDWYTKLPSYQVDAIAHLIYSVGQVLRTMPVPDKSSKYDDIAYARVCLKASWTQCVEALGGQIANPS